MANRKFWLGILAMVLALGMMVVGCDTGTSGTGGTGGTGGSSSLVAKWYSSQESANAGGDDWVFDIRNDGKFIFPQGVVQGGEITWETSGSKINLFTVVSGHKVDTGTANYTLAGKKLTLSNGTSVLQAFTTLGPYSLYKR